MVCVSRSCVHFCIVVAPIWGRQDTTALRGCRCLAACSCGLVYSDMLRNASLHAIETSLPCLFCERPIPFANDLCPLSLLGCRPQVFARGFGNDSLVCCVSGRKICGSLFGVAALWGIGSHSVGVSTACACPFAVWVLQSRAGQTQQYFEVLFCMLICS